jgi:hypothetical protein
MNKDFLKTILRFIPTIISLIIATFIWKFIKFEFTNPNEIVGYYSIFQHSHWNDNIRFIFFIGLPLTTYFMTILFIDKIKFLQIKKSFLLNDKIKPKEKINKLYLFFLLFLLFFIFLSQEFNKNPIDLFHEGQALVGGLNFEITKKLWSGSFIVTSLFVDILSAKISWDLFDVQSIGSYRLYINLITKVTLIIIFIFLYLFSNNLNLNKNSKTLIFLILSIFCFSLIKNYSLSYREIPIFLYLICLINILDLKKISIINILTLGLLPLFSLLWSLDRGIFLIATYIPMILLMLINNRFKQLFSILLIILISFLLFFFLVGYIEFSNFLFNSIDILKSSDLLNGIIHPSPFSNEAESSRATKSLLLIIVNGIFVISLLFNRKSKLDQNHKIFIFILYFLAIIFYKIGLTRSDGGHIKQGSSFIFILSIYFILFYFFSLIEKKFFFYKLKNIYFNLVYLVLLLIFLLQNVPLNFYNNIYSFKDRFNIFIKTDDYKYLNKNEIRLINRLKDLTQNETCFQVFTYETAIQYYLKKNSCTKFFHIMNMGSKNNQLIFIDQIKNNKSKYLLVGGSYQNIGNMKGRNNTELGPKDRFVYIEKYINENFEIYDKIDKWEILKRK